MTNAAAVGVVVDRAASIGSPSDPVHGTADSRAIRKMKRCMAVAAA